jgi:predicted ATP-grasp superfamily ATP-dependent carboligase
MANRLPPAVLLDMDVPGLAIARSLGRRGVEVWALDARADRWALHSRYCQRMRIPGLTEGDGPLLEAMIGLGRRLGDAVLYGLHDDYVSFIVRHREQLEHWYRITHAHNWALEALIDKRRLAALCEQTGIPIPRTWVPRGEDEVRALSGEMRFPCLIKPAFSRSWRTQVAERVVKGAKVIRVGSKDELLRAWQSLSQIGSPMLLQEQVPGRDGTLYYCTGYYGKGGDALGQVVNRKLRTVPAHLGVGTLIEGVLRPEVTGLSQRLARALNYRGNLGVEFKLDARDRRFKLIEANARFGLSDGFAGYCGVDVAYCAYRDAIGAPVSLNGRYRTGIRWLHLDKDLHAVAQLLKAHELGLGAWLLSLARVRSHAALALDDLSPFLYYSGEIARRYMRRALRSTARQG